jgi:hypothetical protein
MNRLGRMMGGESESCSVGSSEIETKTVYRV